MTPKEFYNARDRAEIEQLCQLSSTTFANFQQIALFNGSVSRKLAKALAEHSCGAMTRDEILFPEEYQQKAG